MMWGSCGTDADKTTVISTGIQVRVWCDSEWKGDGNDRDGDWGGGSGWDEKPTLEPTLAPSDEKWNGGNGWNDKDKDGDWGGGSGWDEKPTLEPTLAPSDEKWNGGNGWNDKDKDGEWGGGGWDEKTADPTSEPSKFLLCLPTL